MDIQSMGYGNVDPNVGRLIQDTVTIVQDIDARLQNLKVGLSQAAPQLAHTLLWKELALQNLQQTGALGGVGRTGIDPYAGITSSLGGLMAPAASPYGFGVPRVTTDPFTGATPFTAPFVSPFATSTSPFLGGVPRFDAAGVTAPPTSMPVGTPGTYAGFNQAHAGQAVNIPPGIAAPFRRW